MSEMIKESKFLIKELLARLERIEANDYDEELKQLILKLKERLK